VQWQYTPAGRKKDEYDAYIRNEIRPILHDLARRCAKEGILRPQAVYGYWPCNSDGDDLIVYAPPGEGIEGSRDQGIKSGTPGEATSIPQSLNPSIPSSFDSRELLRFTFPRQHKDPFWCLSDFWRPVSSGEVDVVAFHIVTVGGEATRTARAWFEQNLYRDYLHLHGLSVEAAEALAEYMHKQIRMELGIAGADAREVRRLFQQGYQGSRYSFGYPACPALEDQAKLWPLLEPGRIGITLSEEFQLDPEQSTSAIVAHHPEARYFNVREKKADAQLAERLGTSS
jgi:5-methyltetrahydrofolate--homocysteine methyltransferase